MSALPRLEKESATRSFVAVEGVYRMKAYCRATRRDTRYYVGEVFPDRDAYVVVDEAHATGRHGMPGSPQYGCDARAGGPRARPGPCCTCSTWRVGRRAVRAL